MKTTDYKKGDVVILSDGKRYEYLGELVIKSVAMNAYKPLDGKTAYATIENAVGEFVPFNDKLAVERVNLKWYQKIADWWKASNRWKHFLFAIPLGAVCGAPFTTGVGLGMEIKDHLYGGKADFVDFALTAVGGVIGHGVMLAVGLDYVIALLISLIF
nr:MAG TPA: putative periplasmic lipoprotein [Caudoviricetes sp.]